VIAHVLVPFLAGSLLVLAVLVLMVVVRKLGRTRSERRSRARVPRYAEALRQGSRADLVRVAARARRAAAADDLIEALSRARADLGPARWVEVRGAAEEAGLVARLRTNLSASRPVARGRAALLTAGLRLPGAARALEPLLADPDVDVRHAALAGLTLDGSPEAAHALLRTLGDGALPVERLAERLGRPWAAPVLLEALSDPALRPVRGWIAETLGLAREPLAAPALAQLLEEGDEEERVRACRALGRIGGPTARRALLPSLGDPYWPVRAQAARALGEIGDPEAAAELGARLSDHAWWVRANAAEALRGIGGPGIDVLREALDAPDRYARDRAAEALSLEAGAR
jgi:HEAT repeat protein